MDRNLFLICNGHLPFILPVVGGIIAGILSIVTICIVTVVVVLIIRRSRNTTSSSTTMDMTQNPGYNISQQTSCHLGGGGRIATGLDMMHCGISQMGPSTSNDYDYIFISESMTTSTYPVCDHSLQQDPQYSEPIHSVNDSITTTRVAPDVSENPIYEFEYSQSTDQVYEDMMLEDPHTYDFII